MNNTKSMPAGARTSHGEEHAWKVTPLMRGAMNACTGCSTPYLNSPSQRQGGLLLGMPDGNDAKYTSTKGGHALASDISDYLLKEAKDIGDIAEYRRENGRRRRIHLLSPSCSLYSIAQIRPRKYSSQSDRSNLSGCMWPPTDPDLTDWRKERSAKR